MSGPGPAWSVGDVVRMRKTHPCGSDVWTIYRVGMDIGIRCRGCRRAVMLPRPRFNHQVREVISRAASPPES